MKIDDVYNQFCRIRFPLPSETQVSELERTIGVELPGDFRRFLLDFNGGYFTDPLINPTSDGCPVDRLDVLSGIGATRPFAELISDDNLALFDDNYPAHVLPIGYTVMGNLLMLITRPEDNGYIVLKIGLSDDFYFLAEGIEEFFGLLQE